MCLCRRVAIKIVRAVTCDRRDGTRRSHCDRSVRVHGRAAGTGVGVAESRAMNVMRVEVSSEDVAEMCLVMCGPAVEKSSRAAPGGDRETLSDGAVKECNGSRADYADEG